MRYGVNCWGKDRGWIKGSEAGSKAFLAGIEEAMSCRGTYGLAFWLLMGALLSGNSRADGPGAVRKGERYYLSIPLSYSVYRADAKACGLPLDKVKCEGSKDLTICGYSQSACERAYVADIVTEEKVILFPSEAKCGGFTVAGVWSAVLFSTVEECQRAVPASRDLILEKVSGYYGSKIVVKRKDR